MLGGKLGEGRAAWGLAAKVEVALAVQGQSKWVAALVVRVEPARGRRVEWCRASCFTRPAFAPQLKAERGAQRSGLARRV